MGHGFAQPPHPVQHSPGCVQSASLDPAGAGWWGRRALGCRGSGLCKALTGCFSIPQGKHASVSSATAECQFIQSFWISIKDHFWPRNGRELPPLAQENLNCPQLLGRVMAELSLSWLILPSHAVPLEPPHPAHRGVPCGREPQPFGGALPWYLQAQALLQLCPGRMLSPCMARAANDDWAPWASSESAFACLAIPITTQPLLPAQPSLGGCMGCCQFSCWGLSWLIVLDLGISAMEAQGAFTVRLLRNQPLILLGDFAASGHVCLYIYVCV